MKSLFVSLLRSFTSTPRTGYILLNTYIIIKLLKLTTMLHDLILINWYIIFNNKILRSFILLKYYNRYEIYVYKY